MRSRWIGLTESDRGVFRSAIAFLDGRLQERRTIDWALALKPEENVLKTALLELIDGPEGQRILEPWRSAWRLIQESWSGDARESQATTEAFQITQRLALGDRSGALIEEIADLVSPVTKVRPFSDWELAHRRLPKRPKSVDHLFSVSLTSSEVVDPDELGLAKVQECPFLSALGHALNSRMDRGLDIARRIGWDGSRNFWKLGRLHRVYYVSKPERADNEHEPDEFNKGIAPVVKLLWFVVFRLSEIDPNAALAFVRSWRTQESPVHSRLWAALARDARVATPEQVALFLLAANDREFWDLSSYPELAELRAKRFNHFGDNDKEGITRRVRKEPPRSHWPKKVNFDIKHEKTRFAVRELRRIEAAGGVLPPRAKTWLKDRLGDFPDLANMGRVDYGFVGTPQAQWVPPNPDGRYELVQGEQRLKALEAGLSSARASWDDDPVGGASDWIRQSGNPPKVLSDIESSLNGGAGYPLVWERFGWAHTPTSNEGLESSPSNEAERVLSLLDRLPPETIRLAIEGISNWLGAWEKRIVKSKALPSIWLKVWPISIEATNATQSSDEEIDLNTIARSSSDQEPMDLDTLNTPVGRLVGVFFEMCPTVTPTDKPFATNDVLRAMRDAIIQTSGRAGLIARHRLIEHLPYFLMADPDWAKGQLIGLLNSQGADALALWRAIGRRTQFERVLRIIGDAMAERAVDKRLGRETRCSLVFSLVVECLHAFKEGREPAVPFTRVQQMLRSLDDEVRAHGAQAIQRFLNEVSSLDLDSTSREDLFRLAAKPFLQQVWPQERSLATPGVSRALADLPATSRNAFVEAVESIERFLVPFECWSMLAYGLNGERDNEPKLSMIDNAEKAMAFLNLLDRTIGSSEGSVIPYDLSDALDQIRKVASKFEKSQTFRRLATAARRG